MSAEPPPPNPPASRHRPWVAVLALLVGLVAAVGATLWYTSRPDTARPDAARDDALRAAKEDRFVQAEPGLKAALARKPDDVEVVEALARGHLKGETANAAEPYLVRWVELCPDDREARRFLHEYYRKARKLEHAYSHGKKLLELEPADTRLRNNLMGQAFSVGRFDESEAYCRELLATRPGDRDLRAMLAEIRRARGDLAGAATVLDQLITDLPGYTPALLSRAVIFLESGHAERAIPLLRDILRTDNQRQRVAGYHLAVALERVGDTDEAKRVTAEVRRLQDVANTEEALRNQPDNLELAARLGDELLTAGHTADGLKFLGAVLARAPDFAPAHRALATHYERAGDPARAADHRRRAGN
ncbi:MAG: tetratricopeptide repeat protein [Planctomycetes bacterium]|nr:tetratricopeptide repeat protein [Planctomycetota bacterium]